MADPYIPTREAELITWSNNFDALITASPTTYGLDIAQAGAFAALNTAWVSAYTVANNALTRSPANIATKNTAKSALIDNARALAAIVQAFPGVTDAELLQLGLTVRDTEPTPIPVPDTAPALDIISAVGRTVKVRAHDPLNPTQRGRPGNALGVMAYTFVGDTAPVEIADWFSQGNFNTTTFDVIFDPATPSGSTVWITAFWIGTRLESGPGASPVSTNIPGGLAAAG